MLKSIVCGGMMLSAACGSFGGNSASDTDKPTFVYVHGFGEGGKKTIPFEKQLKTSLNDLRQEADVKTFIYSPNKIDFTDVIDQWHREKRVAETSGDTFYKEVILPLEEEAKPYYIIAYSLGTRVIADFLEQSTSQLEYLKGIYFVGSALPHDVVINRAMMPDGMKIVNYYSSDLDYILKISFRVAEGKNAGGEVGFDDTDSFVNMRTVCTHARKGGLITRDYSDMAEAFVFLVFYKENILIKGEQLPYNIKAWVQPGYLHWNDLIKLRNQSEEIIIQQNVNTGHYRAVLIDEDKRWRIAWGGNMHSVLAYLGMM